MISFENLLPNSYADTMEKELCSGNFPWFFMNEIGHDYYFNGKFENPLISNPIGLSHTACIEDRPSSEFFGLFQPVLYFLEQKTGLIYEKIIRIRVRRTFQTKGHFDGMYNLPHIDSPLEEPYKTLVYYVNDSDGDTILFKEKHEPGTPTIKDVGLNIAHRSSPIKNNAILFDGDTFHAGNCPVNHRDRMIINFDFTVKSV